MKADKPLTKREIKKAARLYAFSILALIDDGGSGNKEESDIVHEAMLIGCKAIYAEFSEVGSALSLSECVKAIKGMRK